MEKNSWHLKISNFRTLHRLDWSPAGVCLLAGPNGSGKSTVLESLRFLRVLFERGYIEAFSTVGGEHFCSSRGDINQVVEFELHIDKVVWRLEFPMTASGSKGAFGEEVIVAGKKIAWSKMFQDIWYPGGGPPLRIEDERCCARRIWDKDSPRDLQSIVDLLQSIRTYKFSIEEMRRGSRVTDMDRSLHLTGKNLWAILAKWNSARVISEGRFDWVMRNACVAFPGLIQHMEFDRERPVIFKPGAIDPAQGLPPARMADGLILGMAILVAVADAKHGATIAIDELENGLHPHAIRAIMKAMRERAEEKDLTIILTTHSPVVMNEYKGRESEFYLIQSENTTSVPVALNEVEDPDWLAHFSLGDLYEREKFAAPPITTEQCT